MSKFHSTISRRNFMKGLGLGAAGLGAAAAAAPVFNDLDEAIASPTSVHKLPWYVSEREYDNPTIEIDWDQFKSFDRREEVLYNPNKFIQHLGEAAAAQSSAKFGKNSSDWLKANKPGYTLRDQALASSIGAIKGPMTFLGSQTQATPEGRGVPIWQGTPAENSRMIRTVAKFFGAFLVGFVELNTNKARKLIYNHGPVRGMNKPIVWEEVPLAYEDDDKYVIPNKCRYLIVFSWGVSGVIQHGYEGALSDISRSQSYNSGYNTQSALQGFLRGIGYQGIGEYSINGIGSKPGSGVLGGIAESVRYNYLAYIPGFGTMDRPWIVPTDLPLEPSKPIDAGMNRFCRTCKKCAKHCPSGALSMETEPSYEQRKGTFNWQGGLKRWSYESPKCRAYWNEIAKGCDVCSDVCTFNKFTSSVVHDVVGATMATTPIFNGFFTLMDDVFNYGTPWDPEGLWAWDDMPPFGFDTMKGRRAVSYKGIDSFEHGERVAFRD